MALQVSWYADSSQAFLARPALRWEEEPLPIYGHWRSWVVAQLCFFLLHREEDSISCTI